MVAFASHAAAQQTERTQLDANGSVVLDTIVVEDTRETATGPVNGYIAGRSATATKTDTPLIETPRSVSVIPREQIVDQGAQSVAQALRYSAGVVSETRPTNGRYDSVFMRGFGGGGTQAAYINYLDGLKLQRGISYAIPSTEVYGLERIEILRGPASVLFGQVNPGGIVNQVSKRPRATPHGEIQVQGGTWNRVQGAFDIGGPVDPEKTLLYRVVGLARTSDTQVDFTKEERIYIAPSVTWQPTEATSLTILSSYQRDPETGFYGGLPAAGTRLPNPNGRIPSSFFPGDPIFEGFSRNTAQIGYEFSHRFNETWAVRQNARFQHIESKFTTVAAASLASNLRTIMRRPAYSRERTNGFVLDNQVEARFNTGALQHTAMVGFDYQYNWANRSLSSGGTASPINFTNPIYFQPVTIAGLNYTDREQNFAGLYAQDQIRLDKWAFLLGIRQDWVETRQRTQASPGSSVFNHTKATDDAFSGNAGVVYLFDNGLAPYASFSTSFEPVSGTDYYGGTFDPSEGEQYEIGLKYQPTGFNSFIQFSAFNLTQTNVLTSDPINPNFSVQTGEIRSRGFEAEARINLFDGLNVIAAYTFVDAKVTKDNNLNTVGRTPVGVPKHSASLWGHYTLSQGPLRGLSLGAGVRYIGVTPGDSTGWFSVTGYPPVRATVPAYTLVDAMLSYDLGARFDELKGFNVAVNANNLFDKEYVSGCYAVNNGCVYGPRRTILGTLSYRW
ncbi:TonB-dependent siderophore receptor [Pseudochelatococcus contaminans]|uniref:TonB-dependent siderophore receptor n=1 Tax=Pseudochelatococcus contaminans TaxID=1538103 RepID=UPI00160FBF8A|nr:TonB-dependent siderophore receptor [Pseudochelatococcus contaminans]